MSSQVASITSFLKESTKEKGGGFKNVKKQGKLKCNEDKDPFIDF